MIPCHIFRERRYLLLMLGLLVVSAGVLLLVAASQATLLVAEGDLSRYWRTTYDILVRPAGSRSPIEEKYGLVEANHLSGIWGGITFEQYEAIKSIPGVEVAAPIATLGYSTQFVLTDSLGEVTEPGVYVLENTLTVDNGISIREESSSAYYYIGSENAPGTSFEFAQKTGIIVNPLFTEYISGATTFSLLLTGIDPSQEAVLTGLDQALINGKYLRGGRSPIPIPMPFEDELENGPPMRISVPALINTTPYIPMTLRSELKRLRLSPEDSRLEEIMARGGTRYLETRPGETLGVQELGSEALYSKLVEDLQRGRITLAPVMESLPSLIVYQEERPPFSHDGLVLGIVMPETSRADLSEDPNYRNCSFVELLNFAFEVEVEGVFNIERLPKPADVNRVPLETYFPPVAILRYDDHGQPVEPRTLHPTRNTCGYIHSPPLLLTTLEAARALRGESAISAIRVRVALDECPPDQPETCTLTDAAQRKIEAIAIEIQRQTGLDVDIMVGSSPKRILVHVPGIGYVEEQWIQKGVNLVYKQGIQTGNWLLLETLLLAGGLFTLDLTWAEALARRRIIALQKALGWYSRTVFTQILGQIMGIGLIATTLGTLIALALIRLLGWESVPLNLLITLPLIVMGLCGIGSLVPAWSASRVPPIAEIQRGGVRYRRRAAGTISGLWSYAWNELKRRTVRSILTGLGSALSAALLTLLLGVTLQQRGMLGGTLLGEFILVNVEGYHYAIVAIGLGLAFLSTFNGLLGSILERRREIGVLKAIGWRTASIARLFIAQGLLLGMVGGSFGALAGSLAFLYFYKSASPDLALVILLGMSLPGLVGALAALYPARLAAKVPPAEALRYE